MAHYVVGEKLRVSWPQSLETESDVEIEVEVIEVHPSGAIDVRSLPTNWTIYPEEIDGGVVRIIDETQ